ncbi:hypothetical protein Ais01nite_52970 [Asanoa ishikariensis]|uniref:Uncharacterized protein n=1 Tax=Asanoa ishikariensis TaxID=137265 RepID=A0A1H3RGB1_9ACTN|nr:hypothetical protein [Asanoa ishikariensis]GIF67262.1 hypothetical protein Ais01nite_52970 [Asanoa ishikariensis]SDZ24375.1 hypothetical protein SAMN05421684_3780 [Asanoa ishikariensis]
MKLSSRFALDMVYLTAGAFLLVAAMTFTSGTAGWLAFAVGAGVTLLAGLSAVRATQRATRIGHGIVAVAALWSLVAALTFTGATQTWLVFANAAGLALLAVADLVSHEVTTERVVHELVVQNAPHDQTVAEPLRAA